MSASFFKKISLLGLGMLLPLALTCLYLWRAGVFGKFWFWTFNYAGAYAAEVTPREGVVKFLDYAHKKWTIYILYLGFIAISLPFMTLNRALRKQILFAAAFLLFSFFGTAIDLNFREHYFILLLPALALFVGLAMVVLQDAGSGQWLKVLAPASCALILGWSILKQRPFFFDLPANIVSAIVYYGDAPFTAMPNVGSYIRAHSTPHDTVAVVGSEPEIYFYAQRHSATGYLYMYPIMEPQPYAARMQQEMITEIESNQPDFLVFVASADSWNVRPGSDQKIFQWYAQYTRANYEQISGITSPISVFKRRLSER